MRPPSPTSRCRRAYGLRQTIADTLGVGGDLPRPAHLRLPRRARDGHAGRGLPRRLAAELHQPDGDEHPVPRADPVPDAQGAGPVPLGLLDRARPVPSWSACRSTRCASTAPASTTRPGCCGGSATAQSLYPLLDERIAERPRAAPPGAGRHVPPARLLPDRDERALQRVRPWYLHDDRPRSNGCASRSATTCRSAPDNAREIEDADPAGRGRGVRRARGGGRGVRPAGDPQHGHRHAADDPGQRRQRRPDRQPAGRRRRRSPLPRRRFGRAPGGRGRPAAAVRRAQPGVPVRGRPDRPGGGRGAARAASGRP